VAEFTTVRDVAEAALFLASLGSSALHGSVPVVSPVGFCSTRAHGSRQASRRSADVESTCLHLATWRRDEVRLRKTISSHRIELSIEHSG